MLLKERWVFLVNLSVFKIWNWFVIYNIWFEVGIIEWMIDLEYKKLVCVFVDWFFINIWFFGMLWVIRYFFIVSVFEIGLLGFWLLFIMMIGLVCCEW